MTDQIPYADYVRIEIRVQGETRVIEFRPHEWDDQDKPQVRIKPADLDTDVIIFGEPSRVRNAPQPWPTMTFEVSGPQSTITVEQESQ